MEDIKQALTKNDEVCGFDADQLHEMLMNLPAHVYLDIFHKMQSRVTGLPFISNGFYGGGCGCVTADDTETESKE